jgi:hypothetical protein
LRAAAWLGFFLAACSGDDTAPAGTGGTDAGADGADDASNGGGGGNPISTGGRADGGREAGTSGAGGSATGGRTTMTGGSSGGPGTGGAPSSGGGGGVPEGGIPDASPEGSLPDGAVEAEAAPCPLPRFACPGACVDLSSDPNHCGDCARVCGALEACVNGSCTTAHCGTVLEFTVEAERSIQASATDGGTGVDGGADGGAAIDGGGASEGGTGTGTLSVPNRLLLAQTGAGRTLDAWIAASDGVYRAIGGTGAALLSVPSLVLPGASQSLAVAKLDADDVFDLVDDSLNDVGLFVGSSPSAFAVAGTIGIGDHMGSVLAVDIDGDQQNEVVVAALSVADNLITLSIYKVPPLAQPVLWRAVSVPLGGSIDVYGLSSGNFDHDGYRDIALAAYGNSSPTLVTFANTPTELVDPVLHALPDGRVRTPLVLDFDGDGFDDVVAVAGRSIHFFGGSNTGLAESPVTTTPEVSFNYADAAAADFDRDGKLDVALVRRVPPSGTQVVLAWGDGNGAFVPDFTQAIPLPSVSGIAAGDVDDDGKPDLVVISAARGSVTAVRNGCN